MHIDFLTSHIPYFKKKKRREKMARYAYRFAIVLAVLLVLLSIPLVLGLSYLDDARAVYALASQGKDNLEAAQADIEKVDLKKALFHLKIAENDFNEAQQGLAELETAKKLPFLKKQVIAAENMASAGSRTAEALEELVSFADELSGTIAEVSGVAMAANSNMPDKEASYADLSPQQKRVILKNFFDLLPRLEEAKQKIGQALSALERTEEDGLISPLKQYISPMKNKLALLSAEIDKALPLAEIIPQIAGYPEEKTYLFLLENNTELRPTGGFIGTYGILKMADGEIKEFKTDNIYNLDRPSEGELDVDPPAPLVKYLKADKWYLRDSNWSPDFPTAARQAEWFYNEEYKKMAGKDPEELDGVIAITPELIKELLKLTGSVEIAGLSFNSDNFMDTLQHFVEIGYIERGISEEDRKEVINSMAGEIKQRLLALPYSQWREVLDIVESALEEKHILIYEKDHNLAGLIREHNWDGRVMGADVDYLMVVDANLASLKTDDKVDRSIGYSIYRKDNKYYAKVSITYDHQGIFDWKTTRLRTYTRVYVPKGSKLVTYGGAMEDDRIDKAGKADVSEEFDKTVFGAFISIEPKQKKELFFEYELPPNVSNAISSGYYELLAQKQPGTPGSDLTLRLDFDKTLQSASPGELRYKWYDDIYDIETDLRTDRNFSVKFKQ